MELNLDQVVEHFRKLKQDYGEGDYQAALRRLAKDLLLKDMGADYINNLLEKLQEKLDLESLKQEAQTERERDSKGTPESSTPEEVVINAVKAKMPNLKTQAQFDLFMRGFDALQLCLNAVYGRDETTAAQARKALDQILELAPQLAEISEKLEGTPEATSNSAFTGAPKEFSESEKADRLLADLESLKTRDSLIQWYRETEGTRNELITQSVRNRVFDAIRAHKKALETNA